MVNETALDTLSVLSSHGNRSEWPCSVIDLCMCLWPCVGHFQKTSLSLFQQKKSSTQNCSCPNLEFFLHRLPLWTLNCFSGVWNVTVFPQHFNSKLFLKIKSFVVIQRRLLFIPLMGQCCCVRENKGMHFIHEGMPFDNTTLGALLSTKSKQIRFESEYPDKKNRSKYCQEKTPCSLDKNSEHCMESILGLSSQSRMFLMLKVSEVHWRVKALFSLMLEDVSERGWGWDWGWGWGFCIWCNPLLRAKRAGSLEHVPRVGVGGWVGGVGGRAGVHMCVGVFLCGGVGVGVLLCVRGCVGGCVHG